MAAINNISNKTNSDALNSNKGILNDINKVNLSTNTKTVLSSSDKSAIDNTKNDKLNFAVINDKVFVNNDLSNNSKIAKDSVPNSKTEKNKIDINSIINPKVQDSKNTKINNPNIDLVNNRIIKLEKNQTLSQAVDKLSISDDLKKLIKEKETNPDLKKTLENIQSALNTSINNKTKADKVSSTNSIDSTETKKANDLSINKASDINNPNKTTVSKLQNQSDNNNSVGTNKQIIQDSTKTKVQDIKLNVGNTIINSLNQAVQNQINLNANITNQSDNTINTGLIANKTFNLPFFQNVIQDNSTSNGVIPASTPKKTASLSDLTKVYAQSQISTKQNSINILNKNNNSSLLNSVKTDNFGIDKINTNKNENLNKGFLSNKISNTSNLSGKIVDKSSLLNFSITSKSNQTTLPNSTKKNTNLLVTS